MPTFHPPTAPPTTPGRRPLDQLPKAHLHVHLDAAMRPTTLHELAEAAGVTVTMPSGYGSFAAFTATIQAASACLRTANDIHRLVDEIVEDATTDGAVWIEPSMWPVPLGQRLGGIDIAVDTVLAAGHTAQARHGTGFGLVVAANRDRGPTEAVAMAELAVSRRAAGVVGFGLDGDEAAAPGPLFAQAFAVARAGGLRLVPHAGELAGPQSVADALDVLGAHRVMHGVTAATDPVLCHRLARSGVPLDVCPTSNLLLSVVPSLRDHPLPQLLARGVACTINADDPLLFGTTLLQEYQIARDVLGLDDTALASCARTSLVHSGAPRTIVETALAGIEEWLR